MEAMDGVEEEEGAHSLVKVFTVPAELVQLGALPEQFLQGEAGTGAFERLVAETWLGGGDDANEIWHRTWNVRTAHRPSRRFSGRASAWASISPPPWLSSGIPLSRRVSGFTRDKGPNQLGSRRSRVCRIPAKVYCPRSSKCALNGH